MLLPIDPPRRMDQAEQEVRQSIMLCIRKHICEGNTKLAYQLNNRLLQMNVAHVYNSCLQTNHQNAL